MIIEVYARNPLREKIVEVAFKEGLMVYTPDKNGNLRWLQTEPLPRDTPLWIGLDSAENFCMLAEHFDVMLKHRAEGTVLLLDSKGGGFQQR